MVLAIDDGQEESYVRWCLILAAEHYAVHLFVHLAGRSRHSACLHLSTATSRQATTPLGRTPRHPTSSDRKAATFGTRFVPHRYPDTIRESFSATARGGCDGEKYSGRGLELVSIPERATYRISPMWFGAGLNHEARPGVE